MKIDDIRTAMPNHLTLRDREVWEMAALWALGEVKNVIDELKPCYHLKSGRYDKGAITALEIIEDAVCQIEEDK